MKNEEHSDINEQQKKSRKKKNLVILALMFLLLLCLFIVQCHLEKMKQDALRRQQETEEEARQKFILDSLRALEMYNDSVLNAKRIADSIAQAEAARIADSIRIADSLAALKGNINWDSLRHVRDSLKHIQIGRASCRERV